MRRRSVLLSVFVLVAALVLVGPAGAEGAINPVISKTRSSGTAPLAVRFDGFTVIGCPSRGVYVSGASPTIRNCIIHNNDTATDDDGAGMFVTGSGSDVTVESCVIYENDADDDGGGVACKGAATLTLTNCTVADNYCTDDGGGIYCHGSGSTLNVENCILWDNSSGSTGDQGCLQVSATCNVDYSDVEGGQNGFYNGSSTLNWGSGNINSTPSFNDQANDDYSTDSSSPCIDAADGDDAPDTDILGNGRVDDGNTTNTGTGTPDYADIGSYEYQG